ncbi:carbonic anhydrase family protein [Waterburya agarophytonicola K14]|uniref:carbonic anhydrase n=1 Tax=Waterburya agarophytonicola KI4 TaxID=2874699 RepID=A0A964FG15_9CYAN|nr:carbonic anhydrase family protein [Waterburya agarophytonicola]MCC0176084.1 carbonic anhydrase family protein [Waterburya agarophytonicola KI4]
MKNSRLWRYQFIISSVFLAVFSAITFNPRISLTEENEPHWGYGGAANPTQWGELSEEFQSCELGRNQSPVDVSIVEEAEPIEIEFDYQPSKAQVIDNGHTIEALYEPGNFLRVDKEVFELIQFHFHTPSEHGVENRTSAMELHLVHRNEAGKLAVVGVLMDPGEENSVIASIWDAIPKNTEATQGNSITINIADLLPDDRTFITYDGSLTIPPCTEEVRWKLFLEPIELSLEQIENFESIHPYNARPLQPLNGRIIEIHEGN